MITNVFCVNVQTVPMAEKVEKQQQKVTKEIEELKKGGTIS